SSVVWEKSWVTLDRGRTIGCSRRTQPRGATSRRCPVNRALLVSLVAFLAVPPPAPAQEKAAPPKAEKEALKETAPPAAVFDKYRASDKEVARKFYKKYLDVKGVAVLASGEVADEALVRTHHIVTHVLAGRPDVLEAMAKNGTRLIVIGKDQVYTDMPEY